MAKIDKGNLAKQNGSAAADSPVRGATVDYGANVKVLLNRRMIGMGEILRTVGRFDPTYVPLAQRYKMREDPMIKLGLQYIRTPIINADYHMESSDLQIAAFALNAYQQIHVRLMNQLLTSMAFGYAGIVQRFYRQLPDWKYEDKEGNEKDVWTEKKIQAILWNEFEVLPPDGLEPIFAEDGSTFLGMRSTAIGNATGGPNDVDVPASHSLWFTHDKDDAFGDWYGRPRTQSAYRYWWSYWYQWLLADRHAEMDADPPMVVRVPADESVPDPDDPTAEITAVELGERIGIYTRDGATVVLPSEVYMDDEGKPTGVRKWDIDFLRGGENLAAFRENFAYMDVMKLRGVLLPEQALIPGNSNSGSKNVAGTEVQQVEKSIETLMGEIDQLVNDVLLPPLIRQNFVEPASVKKVTTGFRPEDLSLLKQIITLIATNDPAALSLDLRAMSKKAGLPLKAPDAEQTFRSDQPPVAGDVNPAGGVNPPAVEGQPTPNADQGGPPGGNQNAAGGNDAPAAQLAASLPDFVAAASEYEDPILASLFADAGDLAALLGPDPMLERVQRLESIAGRDQPPPHIEVHPPNITVNPPSVHVTLPEQGAPHVEVHTPDVTVQPADIQVDVQPADVKVEPHIEVRQPPPGPRTRKITRDGKGDITEIRDE